LERSNSKIVSVIIPVFNIEKYIKKCIESVISQTFKDLEIILIDDGSTDLSSEICKEFEKKDQRILVISQKNQGLSAARNRGIKISSGRYLTFVDGDDLIEKDMIEFLLDDLLKNDADISVCGIWDSYKKSDGNIQKMCRNFKNKFGILKSYEALKEVLINGKISLFAVAKLYKREIFDKIEFPVGLTYEDAHTIPLIITKVKTISYNLDPKYLYMRRQGSITNSCFKVSDFSVIKAYEKHLDMVKKFYPEALDHIRFRLLWSYVYLLDKIIFSKSFPKKELKNIVKIIRKNSLEIFSNKFFTLKRKLMILILIFSFTLYRIVTMRTCYHRFKNAYLW